MAIIEQIIVFLGALTVFLGAFLVSSWALSPRVTYEELLDIEDEVTDDK